MKLKYPVANSPEYSIIRLLNKGTSNSIGRRKYKIPHSKPCFQSHFFRQKMMASTLSTHFIIKLPNPQQVFTPTSCLEAVTIIPTKPRRKNSSFSTKFNHLHPYNHLWNSFFKPKSCSVRSVLRKVSGDGGASNDTPQEPASVSVSSKV